LRDAGLFRELRSPCGVDLTSNDYLGLARHPLVIERLAYAARHEGCGSTGSRLLRGHRDVFGAVEQRFAAFKGTDWRSYLAFVLSFMDAAQSTQVDSRPTSL
jgi:8-amino-7-oxononanoate synthase